MERNLKTIALGKEFKYGSSEICLSKLLIICGLLLMFKGFIMKLLLACTSGGHFTTMKGLREFWSVHDRVWVTDTRGNTQFLTANKEKVHWLPYQGPRDWRAFLANISATFKILRAEKPDTVISTGASIAVNFAIVAKFLGIRYVFIESLSRSKELSLSGKLVYFLADEFYVQWPELSLKYPKAVFEGIVA